MSIFSNTKNKGELILVFNVGSTSAEAALFLAQESGIPKIIFSISEPIEIEKETNIDRFLSQTIKSLESIVKKVYEAKLGAPKRIFCVLSSHWCISQTRIISLKKNTPFIFTEKLADELIKKEVKLFEEENLVKYAIADNVIRIIELKNIKIMLNGYETPKPLDQKAKELEMTIFLSMCTDSALRKIENIILKYFHITPIRFSSFALSSFTVVRDMYAKQEDFLLVDIGGEVTDIFMVKKNMLRESISFPFGRNFFKRGVSSALNCTIAEANSMISMLKDGHAEVSIFEKLSFILKNLQREWLSKFQESLINISSDISIPATIYTVLDKDVADFFSEIIKTEQFSQYTLTESKFEVIFLDTSLFNNVVSFDKNIICDSIITIDAVYINRFLINSAKNRKI